MIVKDQDGISLKQGSKYVVELEIDCSPGDLIPAYWNWEKVITIPPLDTFATKVTVKKIGPIE